MRGYIQCALFMLAACADDPDPECLDQTSCVGLPPDSSCTPSAQVAKLSGAQSLDCGTVNANATRAEYERARQCVLDALAHGDAFHAIKWEQGIDSLPATAFVSAGGGQPVTLISYDSDPSGGGGIGASMSKRSCSTLQDNDANPTCADEYRYQLCLVCAELDAPSQALCRGTSMRSSR